MKNLPIDAIRAFTTAADLGSISTTAEQLNRSQPAISLQIKRLEELLGKTLLMRSNRRLCLSDDGVEIYDLCKQLLATNDLIIAKLDDDVLGGQIKLGIPSEFATTLLPNIVGRFAQAYPNVALEVLSDLSKNLTSEARREQFDMVLALHDKPNPQRRGLLRSDELVWVGKSDWVRNAETPLSLVLAQEGCIYRKRALKKLKQDGISARIVHTNPDLAGIQSAIDVGLGITVLAKSTVPENLNILENRRYDLPELGTIDISLQFNRRTSTEAVQRLADFIGSSLL